MPTRYTLLELVQQVCAELAINRPQFVIGNNDPQVAQLLALVQRLGRDLTRQFEWQWLNKEYSFTTVSGQTEYPLPADWGRQIPQTEWDRSSRWPLIGPATTQQWQLYKSGVVSQGPRIRFRIANNKFEIFPEQDNYTLVFNYISNHWVIASDGQTRNLFAADSDTCIYEDSLMIAGLKSLWKAAKGLDGTFDLAEFRTILEQLKSQDHSAKKLSLSPSPGAYLLTLANIQDGSWPAN